MKRFLVAVLVLSSGSAGAMEGLFVENLRDIRAKVGVILTDARWAHGDTTMRAGNARDFFVLHERFDTMLTLLPAGDGARADLEKLVTLTTPTRPNGGDTDAVSLKQFDTFLAIHDTVTTMLINQEHRELSTWRATPHGELISILSAVLHQLLRSFIAAEGENARVTDLDIAEKAVDYWVIRAYSLSKLTQDQFLKDSLFAIGRGLEDRKHEVPTVAHPNARQLTFRTSIMTAYLAMDDLARTLDVKGLNCEMALKAPRPLPGQAR